MKQFLAFVFCFNLLAGLARAHPMNSTLILLEIHEHNVQAELRIPLSELGLALEQNLTTGELLPAREAAIRDYLGQHVRASGPDGQPWTVKIESLLEGEMVQTGASTYRELEAHLSLIPPGFISPTGVETRVFNLRYDAVIHTVPTHIALVSIRQDWRGGITPELEPTTVGIVHLDPLAGKVAPLEIDRSGGSLWRGFAGMFRVGWLHIAEGTDHLLFLLTLLLPAVLLPTGALAQRRGERLGNRLYWGGFAGVRRSLSGILKIVTAFTVGHSLTLIFGAVFRINIPAQPIEALIAFSILVSAVHALRPIFPQREVWVAGGFGLIHGMAFSFTLAALQLNPAQMALSLLGFNLGIEAMQLVVIALTIPWLILLARTPFYAPVQTMGALLAGFAALGWLGQRLGLENPLGTLADALSPHGVWVIVGLALIAVISSGVQRFRPNVARP